MNSEGSGKMLRRKIRQALARPWGRTVITACICIASLTVCTSAEVYTIEVPIIIPRVVEENSEGREFYTTEGDSEGREFYTTEDDSVEKPENTKTAGEKNKTAKEKKAESSEKKEEWNEPVEMGRLSVPDLNVDVTLYYTDCYTNPEHTQELCDRPGTAVWLDFAAVYGKDCQQIIGDHINQGFAWLSCAVPGETLAYVFNKDNTVDTYICTEMKYGHNCEEDGLQTEDGTLVAKENLGGVCMYTCNGRWEDVILTYWKNIRE